MSNTDVIYFDDPCDLLEKLKLWKLTPKTFKAPKPLCYRMDDSSSVPAEVIGYVPHDQLTILVIDVGGIEHKICVEYLREMQSPKKESEE